MTNTPSPTELIDTLRSWPGMSEGDALSVSTVALIMENAADRLESLEEALKRIALGSFNDEWVVLIAREALNRSTDRG